MWLENGNAENRTGATWRPIVIKQWKCHLWLRGGIFYHQCAATAHDATQQHLFAEQWTPILRTNMYSLLCRKYHRWLLLRHFLVLLSPNAKYRCLTARNRGVEQEHSAT